MRRSSHPTGSPVAQSTLQAIAGWLPTRRGFLSSLLVAGAATTAVTTGAAIVLPAAAADDAPIVSPRMAELVDAYKQAIARIDNYPPKSNPEAWQTAEDDFLAAQATLINEPPATIADFSLKFDALMEVEDSDGEFAAVKRLSDDAQMLARSAK
jgi:hypothetical protein